MFITLEGIEGAGKTTQLENIVAFFKTRGYEVVTTREPGGTPIGGQIRSILLDPANTALDAATELLLYVADRVQHLRTFIEPHLAAGHVVVCDRYFDATLVYQGYARGLDKEMIRGLHHIVCGNAQPVLTLLFDLDPKVGLERAWRRINNTESPNAESRFEKEALSFHRKVRDGYLDLARLEPDRIKIVNAEDTQDRIARDVNVILESLLTR